MNIVLVTDFACVNGGASKVALMSARALAQRGHNVILFAGVGPIDPMLEGIPNLTVHCLGMHEILNNPNRLAAMTLGLWNPKTAEALRRILETMCIEDTIVHLHMWGKALSSSVTRMTHDMGFAQVLTVHDYLPVCPIGTLYLHKEQMICQHQPMSRACMTTNCDARNYVHKVWRLTRQAVQQGPGRLPDGICDLIVISPTSRRVIEERLPEGYTPRFHLVENPVDVMRMPPVDVMANTTFSFMGRMAAEKGPVLFARAAKLAQASACFIGTGGVEGQVRAANPEATITGWKSAEEALTLLRASRALVFPSQWYETQGLVVAEALAMGIPAIVPDISAACDWVIDGENGLVFRSGDEEDLAGKILWLRDNPSEAVRMGRNAYERYWKNPMTLQKHIAALEDVYETICQPARVEI